ncbi:MAG: hypothetical protein E4H03_08810 [Myxococcales bacterium]|nr:MAG: hypothetical protein E4H03_08810 [Myxococcales bacterium]
MPDDGFVVAWSDSEVVVRIFNGPQDPMGAAIEVSDPGDRGGNADIAAGPSGEFIVVWQAEGSLGDDDVFVRRFDSTGSALGPSARVRTSLGGFEQNPRVALLADGSSVVAWDGAGAGSSPSSLGDIWARRYDSAGTALAVELMVNEGTPGAQRFPAIAAVLGGGYVITWNTDFAVFARLFDSNGDASGGDIRVDDVEAEPAFAGPVVASSPDGGFVVGWKDRDSLVHARRFDATGIASAASFELADGLGPTASVDSLVFTVDGDLVAFLYAGGDVFVRTFDEVGAPTSALTSVNERLARTQSRIDSSRLTGGSFVVVWHDDDYLAREARPRGQRVCDHDADPGCEICLVSDDAIDVDADGVPDGCDACINAGAQSISEKARVTISNPQTVEPIDGKKHKLGFKGRFVLPGVPGSFASLDPASDGVRIRIEAASKNAISDVSVPGGVFSGNGTAGWNVNGAGTKWSFKDTTGDPDDGITRIKLIDRTRLGPNLVEVQVKGFGGAYPISSLYLPVRGIVVLGDAGAGASGLCGETAFEAGDCKSTNRRLRCRQ